MHGIVQSHDLYMLNYIICPLKSSNSRANSKVTFHWLSQAHGSCLAYQDFISVSLPPVSQCFHDGGRDRCTLSLKRNACSAG